MLEPAYPLRTPRLDLRPYESSDLDHLRAMYARDDVTRYLYSEPMGEDELLAYLEKKVARRAVARRARATASTCWACCATPVTSWATSTSSG